ncbi:MAG: CRTAC1 family protein [Acidobacteria bacterium]|nr:CRTAC1 family protein [Acidobacteriota bacterium]MCI0720946.1 CRTAC1 family protein [Acidobacteriota bacterium]
MSFCLVSFFRFSVKTSAGAGRYYIPIKFVDVSAQAQIHFRHTNAASGEKYLIETMGGGGGFLDYNNDGLLDIYLVNGRPLPGFKSSQRLSNALYRNQGDGTFKDVTEEAGVSGNGYGMGGAAADYDNDGFVDLFVTNFGLNTLYRNNGNGTFSDVTLKARVQGNEGWATSAGFFDYDNDGFLDLNVCYYLDFKLDRNIRCGEHYRKGFRSYCHPDQYPGVSNKLYRNNRDGTFADVSETAGIANPEGKGLGVVLADLDDDGFMDIYVANDSVANFLYHNNGNGTFTDIALTSGTAYNENGEAQAGMGTDAGDSNGDGRQDLLVTNLDFEGTTLYQNNGNSSFTDMSFPSGLAEATMQFVGFGARFVDFDNDGDQDIFTANGHVIDNIEQVSDTSKYLQPKLLLENREGRFVNMSKQRGPGAMSPSAGRGLATGDYDNDGDIDFLVMNCNQSPNLLQNQGGNQNHWISIKLLGVRSNRDGIGAKVHVVAGRMTQRQQVKGGMSYLSMHDPRLHFGLGRAEKVDLIEVHWPSRVVDRVRNARSDQVVTIRESQGLAKRPSEKR